MRAADKARLIDFLRIKQCSPCRRGEVNRAYPACREGEELIRIVEAERAT